MNAPAMKTPGSPANTSPCIQSRTSVSRPAAAAAGTAAGKPAKIEAEGPRGSNQGTWKAKIENADSQALWRSLNRLVAVHPLVRSALGIQQNAPNGMPSSSINDLTQDLYVLLLQKRRFDHYVVSQMSDSEIEREIFQIELTNLLIGSLRRRRPENYRIVRRVSGVLESESMFRQFQPGGGRRGKPPARYRQAAEAVYGLSEWPEDKRIKDSGTFADLIVAVPMRRRNRRRAGCTGDTQVIVSNQELVELMLEILTAIDSPAPLRVLRQLALTKLPVCDPEMTAIDDDADEDRSGRSYEWAASGDDSPEQAAMRGEQEREARRAASAFLDHLGLLNRSNTLRTERFWRVLWHCYFDPEEPSQLEIADLVGISDSSVSDYRRKIEVEMRKLRFAQEDLRCFADELDEQLRWRLSLPEKAPDRREFEAGAAYDECGFARYEAETNQKSRTTLAM
ncbi:MAG: hypothetical protein ACKVX9_14285 [Blastocatellia bacterium]